MAGGQEPEKREHCQRGAYPRRTTVWNGSEKVKRVMIIRGELLSVADLMRLPDIGPEESRPHITYAQAASFVGFLAERFSLEALRRAYATLTLAAAAHENEAAFAQAFGLSSDEAAALWLASLRTVCLEDYEFLENEQ